MQEARRLVADMRVLQWIREENSAHGLAPPPRTLLQKRKDAGLAPTQYGTAESQPETEAGPNKWIQRFRRRWGLHLGALPVEETVPVELARSKVAGGLNKLRNIRGLSGPGQGASFRPLNWDRCRAVVRKAGPENGPSKAVFEYSRFMQRGIGSSSWLPPCLLPSNRWC